MFSIWWIVAWTIEEDLKAVWPSQQMNYNDNLQRKQWEIFFLSFYTGLAHAWALRQVGWSNLNQLTEQNNAVLIEVGRQTFKNFIFKMKQGCWGEDELSDKGSTTYPCFSGVDFV